MKTLVLNKQEAAWLSRNVLKTYTILNARAKKEPEVLDKITYKVLAALQVEANQINDALTAFGDEMYEFEISMGKIHCNVLRDMISKTKKNLTDKIIPVYTSRGLDEYKNDAQVKVLLLTQLEKKL